MKALYVVVLILATASAQGVKEVFRREGDLNVALILRDACNNTASLTTKEQSLVNSAIWTTHQLNLSEFLPQITFGLSVYKTCNEREEYETIFEVFRKKSEEVSVGLVTTSRFSVKMQKFCEVLELNVKQTVKCTLPLIKASVALLKSLNWVENVVLVADDEAVVREFLKLTRNEWICVAEHILYDATDIPRNLSSQHFVLFGDRNSLTELMRNSDISNAIVVPWDDSIINEVPENSYVISTINDLDHQEDYYTPNSQLFEIATPLVTYAQNLKQLIDDNCNVSNYKQCVKKFKTRPSQLEPDEIADLLKIETSSINFYIYKSDNVSLVLNKIFFYNIFSDNLTQLSSIEVDNSSRLSCISQYSCRKHCKNFEIRSDISSISEDCRVRIRTESWVFAFLSLSLLGILLCMAILIFLLVAICRRNVLDGNPVLTILLLLTVMLMYCSVLPFALDGQAKNTICIARALSITLSFSAAFSLILSRSILLATASKEIGFMSHVAGPVQAFLCLFIFGVQAALSMQVVNRCGDVFKGFSFLYLLSYNVMLVLLLLCLSPLIFKCQRNYKEGKYFTLAAITISLLWCCWVPAYALMDKNYRDTVLCFGLVGTASGLLGTIFVPRTYLMTIAAAREKMTSTLPSLAATASVMDIYRSGSQPVYDCVNVAAINAVTVARAGLTQLQQPDLYTCPNLPEDDDFDVRCESPVNDDKVTRF